MTNTQIKSNKICIPLLITNHYIPNYLLLLAWFFSHPVPFSFKNGVWKREDGGRWETLTTVYTVWFQWIKNISPLAYHELFNFFWLDILKLNLFIFSFIQCWYNLYNWYINHLYLLTSRQHKTFLILQGPT